ncbi:URC4/urg3 family protein [Nostoc sp. FACHB-110]|uniref:URC4/urg3 family protein n=1 Tax=Nostoc sp. FACHB-110 TaxID=2692834 RepID=UPI0016861D26|nr:DUF1688 family protein [Nostoc sp. FACHB-110]MBD2435692.1 URC4/urg3 family protein [Nostoc sp. FACHB-110]
MEKTTETQSSQRKIEYLRSPKAIRERCGQIFALVNEGKSRYFTCDLSQLGKVADYVVEVMRCEYPDLNIPFHSRWRHFEAQGVPRLTNLNNLLAGLTPLQQAIAKFDLAIVSVLLDAGAGESWRYHEQSTGLSLGRSEGLAIASFEMFCQGAFSLSGLPQVDALKLLRLTEAELASGFQVSAENPLVGISGRSQLLQKLGRVVVAFPHLFGEENPRPGNLVNYLVSKSDNGQLAASTVFSTVLEGLSDIWPPRLTIAEVNLGDVWQHWAVTDDRLVPFHKLSQWLTYSLLEPLQELGLIITDLDALTGLPEYRNGGLCLDLGLISIKDPDIFHSSHSVGSELIIEWRALTVILLDEIAATVRQKLDMSVVELPLVKILQGGTWTAGRKIAAQLRKSGQPPIQIDSDGTVF